jgi:hypothetical protein
LKSNDLGGAVNDNDTAIGVDADIMMFCPGEDAPIRKAPSKIL